jgi:arginyl-tRNA synthetase
MTFYDAILTEIKAKLGISDLILEVPREKSFGDFATNIAMQMAKSEHKNPKQIAADLLPKLREIDFVSSAEIAGAGFINIKIKDDFIVSFCNFGEGRGGPDTDAPARGAESPIAGGPDAESGGSESRGDLGWWLPGPDRPQTIDLDYGAYNVAKDLHIGHLRTSIVGDTIYRIARFLGHRPISYNHLGDWGRPMALVIAWIIRNDIDLDNLTEAELNGFYPAASALAAEDPDFMETARTIKREFQDGNPRYFGIYERFLPIAMAGMNNVVRRLNIVPFDNNLGERNAAKYLAPVEKILRGKDLVKKSDGAEVVNLKTDADNAPMPPLMWTDSRGADTYDSTDLAALYYRKITDAPGRMIYITDLRQKLHFEQVFRAARLAGIYPYDRLEHIGYGTINGADGRPFKTRDGNVASLGDIIDAVEDAARARVRDGGKNLPEAAIKTIALAALKFNDLMHDVKSDYVFDPAAVVSFEGRTGPYILYTAVRLNSILKKAGSAIRDSRFAIRDSNTEHRIPNCELRTANCELRAEERDLLLKILEFPRVVAAAFDRRAPDMLANYTYDLCQLANGFYHNCPVAGNDARIAITRKTAAALTQCLDLMGLEVPEEM